MIDRLEIHDFKSIRELKLDLGRVNIFLGANGAGKSNLLEALGVVSAASYGSVDDESLLRRGVRPGVPRLYKTSNRYYQRAIRRAHRVVNRKTMHRTYEIYDEKIEIETSIP